MPLPILAFSVRRWALYCALAVVVLFTLFHYVDMPLTRALHAGASSLVFDIFDVIDELGSSEFYLVPALLLYVWSLLVIRRGWSVPQGWVPERIARASLFVILTMALGGVVTLLLKLGVARARPELLLEQGIYGLGVSFAREQGFDSFPSSHTQAAFAAAAALAILMPRWRIPLMIVACCVATARLVNLDHYLSDVLAAAFIALASAAFLAPRILNASSAWPLRSPWRWFSTRH